MTVREFEKQVTREQLMKHTPESRTGRAFIEDRYSCVMPDDWCGGTNVGWNSMMLCEYISRHGDWLPEAT